MATTKSNKPLSPLQEKFLDSGLKNLSDPEILELLLSLGTPDRDYRKLATRIITRFANLKQLLDTPAEQIRQIPAVSNRDILTLRIVGELFRKIAIENIMERPIYETGRIIFEYLYQEMRWLGNEHAKLICLDDLKKIIETIDLFDIKADDSLSQSLKIIIEHALRCRAKYFILVHNHASGDPKPSQTDKDITRDLIFAGMILQIKSLDHVIIGKDNFFSFANEGLISEYETEFLGLKLHGTSAAKRRLDSAKRAAGKP